MSTDTTKSTPTSDAQAASPDFHPAPGYILAKPLTRDEVSNMTTSLSLPELAGKEKDAVGVARVIELGPMDLDTQIKAQKNKSPGLTALDMYDLVAPGDLVAYMPFTDMIILHGYEKRNLVAYKNVVAIAKVAA